MADGQLFKPEKDYTKEADKQIPEAHELAKVRTPSALPRINR
jgi:26S proteasome regulatory subunit N5